MSSPFKRKRPTLDATNCKRTVNENNNIDFKSIERQQARQFILWYKQIIDYDRENLGLYLSDDVVLDWFGRTIKNRKKVSSFLKFDMQCSRHDFKSIESIDKVCTRQNRTPASKSTKAEILASPISPELINSKPRRPGLRSAANSPEWDVDCKPVEPVKNVETKSANKFGKHPHSGDSGGDRIVHHVKRKCIIVTPPNREIGQGDCPPSTSGNVVNISPILNIQRKAVECIGYIEFTRTRNKRSVETMKWDRKCKVQICYSEDPLNVGEYIIWSMHYTDESKCRRNLLSAFEEVAREEELKRNIDDVK